MWPGFPITWLIQMLCIQYVLYLSVVQYELHFSQLPASRYQPQSYFSVRQPAFPESLLMLGQFGCCLYLCTALQFHKIAVDSLHSKPCRVPLTKSSAPQKYLPSPSSSPRDLTLSVSAGVMNETDHVVKITGCTLQSSAKSACHFLQFDLFYLSPYYL